MKKAIGFFVEIDKSILKFIGKQKESIITKTTLKKKNNIRGLTLCDVETYHKTTVIRTMRCWHKKK